MKNMIVQAKKDVGGHFGPEHDNNESPRAGKYYEQAAEQTDEGGKPDEIPVKGKDRSHQSPEKQGLYHPFAEGERRLHDYSLPAKLFGNDTLCHGSSKHTPENRIILSNALTFIATGKTITLATF